MIQIKRHPRIDRHLLMRIMLLQWVYYQCFHIKITPKSSAYQPLFVDEDGLSGTTLTFKASHRR